MMAIQDIEQRVPIVDPATGKATDYLLWALRERGQAQDATEAGLAGKADKTTQIIAGSGLTGGGDLSADVTLNADAQAILDQISATQGTILYRGATDWAALAPGAAGQFLKTNGPGADPVWAPIGGGGGGNWWFDPPLASSFSLMTSDGVNLTLTDDADAGLLVNSNPPTGTGARTRVAYRTLTTPAAAWDMIVRMPFFYPTTGNNGTGLIIHNSTSGRSLRLGSQDDRPLIFQRYSALGTFNSIIVQPDTAVPVFLPWFRFQFDGTTYTASISIDGKLWLTLQTETAANYLTAAGGTGDRVGIFTTLDRNSGMNNSINVDHFSLTGPGV